MFAFKKYKCDFIKNYIPMKTAFLYWKTIFVSAKIRGHACFFPSTPSSLSLKKMCQCYYSDGFNEINKENWHLLAKFGWFVKMTCHSFVSKESFERSFCGCSKEYYTLGIQFGGFFFAAHKWKGMKICRKQTCNIGVRVLWRSENPEGGGEK